MKFRRSAVLFTILASSAAAFGQTADNEARKLQPLSNSEVQTAINLERDKTPALFLPLKARDPRSPLADTLPSLKDSPAADNVPFTEGGVGTIPDITVVGAPGLIGPEDPRRAKISRFDYPTGFAVSTIVDLDNKTVLDVSMARNKPVGLSSAEFTQAVALASQANREIASLVREKGPDGVPFDVSLPVHSSKESPFYGHRLVLLSVEEPRRTPRVLIDLSMRKVLNQD